MAKQAKVSISTVSRVVGNYGSVSEKMRQRVLKAVEELGYHPDAVARSMVKKKTYTLGLIISDIANPFFTAVVRGVEDIANKYGYNIILCNTDEDPQKEIVYLKVLREKRIDGIIMAPTGENIEYIQAIQERNIPLVFMDRRLAGIDADAVLVDNVDGAYQAVSHLIKLGHKRIGIVSGITNVWTGKERLRGYKKALEDYGLPIEESLIKEGYFKLQGGYRATQEFLKMENRPTALFTANNLMTIGALLAIKEQGLKIPGDIAIVGFDDMDWTPLMDPSLTCVAQPTYTLGTTAAELLIQSLSKGTSRPIQEIVLKPRLILRESCGYKMLIERERANL